MYDDLKEDIREIRKSQESMAKDIHAFKLHQNTVSTSAKIYRAMTSALLACLVTVAGYFFAVGQNHEGRITRAESGIEIIKARNSETRQDLKTVLDSLKRGP